MSEKAFWQGVLSSNLWILMNSKRERAHAVITQAYVTQIEKKPPQM